MSRCLFLNATTNIVYNIFYYTYDKLSRICETNLGNLYTKQYYYLQKGDQTSNLIASEWFGKDGKLKDNLKYKYDINGNITNILENGIEIARYTYDSLSRLIREDNKNLNKTTLFEYDGGGNLLNKRVFNYTTNEINVLGNGTVIPYVYPTTGWRDQLASYNGQSIIYDNVGNPTIYLGKSLSWSHNRQLDRYDNTTFAYNAEGIRISKTNNNITTNYYLEGTKILAQSNGNTLIFHYGMEGIIGFTYQGVGEYYYKKNILGDVIGIIDSNGQEVAKYEYDAWGNHKVYAIINANIVDITNDTNYNNHISKINPFRYRGYYFDTETGLYYLNSRYYDPEIGRFINADDISILLEGKDIVNGLNLFAYCGNNPIMNTDDDGCAWWHWLVGALIVVAAVALTIATAGVGTAIAGALGGGLMASIIGGAVGGAISGAIMSFGISTAIEGVSTGFTNMNWGAIGISTLIGFASGAVLGAIGGAIKYFATTTRLYRAVSGNELSSIVRNKTFMSEGFSEGKYFALNKNDALSWGNKMYLEKNYYIVNARVSNKLLRDSIMNGTAYYWEMLDRIGPAYYIEIDSLVKILRSSIRF